MFTGHFIEASTNVVELANKDINHIVWMLDYIYPEKVFDLTGGYNFLYISIKLSNLFQLFYCIMWLIVGINLYTKKCGIS